MTPLALEYQRLRQADLKTPVACIKAMVSWRQQAIEAVLKNAEKVGLPESMQALVVELDDEVRHLTGALEKAVTSCV